MHPYIITLESDYSEFWRYNLIVQGEVLWHDTLCGDVDYSSIVTPSESDLSVPPAGYHRDKSIVIETAKGDSLRLYIYILPHTDPFTNKVADSLPFEFRVMIHQGGKLVFKHRYEVDQWSGCNIEFDI